MPLFDDFVRTDDTPAKYAESSFPFLNRSSRDESRDIRDKIDSWYSRYPDSGKTELYGRFRDKNEYNFQSAFFELLLHELLIRLQCQVSINPAFGHTARRPDFRVRSAQGDEFILEATIAMDLTKEEMGAEARKNEVYDAINRLDSPNFFIGIDIEGSPQSPPSARRMRDFLSARLRELNPDHLAQALERGGLDALPKWRYEDSGWILTFSPIPKSAEARNTPGLRPIGVQMTEVKTVNPEIAIRNGVLEKADAYGDLQIPYVVAVNGLGEFVRVESVYDALFGDLAVVVHHREGEVIQTSPTRTKNGVWNSHGGPCFPNLSGVLYLNKATPWKIDKENFIFIHNPWTARPYNSILTAFDRENPAFRQEYNRLEF